MTLDEYSAKVGETAVYSGSPLERLNYASVAMGGEVGEYLNEYKKYLRLQPYSHQLPDNETCARMLLELGDTLWYLTRTAHELGSSLEQVAQMNIDKLAARYDHKGV
jgi:NTP pyrophosphatase (non-canonical NTP hydrolase)